MQDGVGIRGKNAGEVCGAARIKRRMARRFGVNDGGTVGVITPGWDFWASAS